jgi:hypothetical protein
VRRREFIAVLTAVTIGARAGSACAQTNGLKRVGVVYQGGHYEPSIAGLRDGLSAAGLEEGRDITLLLRNVRGDVAAAESAARALERDEKVEVIGRPSENVTGVTHMRDIPVQKRTYQRSSRAEEARAHSPVLRRSGDKDSAPDCKRCQHREFSHLITSSDAQPRNRLRVPRRKLAGERWHPAQALDVMETDFVGWVRRT